MSNQTDTIRQIFALQPEGVVGGDINPLNMELIRGGGSDSSTFFRDLDYMDMLEAAEDEELFRMLGVKDSGLTGTSKDVYDAILQASAATDTAGEYLDDVTAAQQGVDIALANLSANTGTDVTSYDPAQEAATAAAIGDLTTAKENLRNIQQAALDSGLVSEQDLGANTLTQDILDEVGGVLGAGTRGLYDVASNVPVVGDFLGDAVEGAADWLKNMEGTLTVNPITGTVQGTWGEVPPWMEKQTVTQVGQIPGSQTIGGVTTGTILDDFISVGRGEQDLEDVFEERGGEIASTVGIDPAIVAAAQAAGKTVKEFLEDQNAKETALAPTTEEDPKEKEKAPAVVDLSGGRDDEEPAAQEVATITPSTSDGTSLPEGVAGPLFVPDTEVTLEEVLEDPIDRTPTGREIVPGFQLPEEPVAEEVDIVEEVIKQTPTERERLPGFQLPEEPVAEEVDIVEEVIKQTPTGREIVPGFQLPEEPVVEPPVLEPPVLEEEPVVEPPVLEEEPVVEPPVVEEEPVVEPPVLEEEPVFEPPVVEEEPVVEPPVLEEEPVFEPPVLEEEPVVEPPVLEEEPATPEVPEIPTSPTMQGYRAVQTKPGGLVDIDYLYDIAGPSIFAPKMQGEAEEDVLAYLYSNLGDSGIVQDYDIEELIRLLESQRG